MFNLNLIICVAIKYHLLYFAFLLEGIPLPHNLEVMMSLVVKIYFFLCYFYIELRVQVKKTWRMNFVIVYDN